MSVRVCHLITSLTSGGAESMLCRLLSRMDRSRIESTVVTLVPGGELESSVRDRAIRLDTLGLRRGVPDPRGVARLVRLLNRERPAILQTWLYHADLLGTVAAKLTTVPRLCWNIRCSNMDMTDYSWSSGMTLRVLARLSGIPEAVVINSEAGRESHERLGYRPRRWCLIPNGFDTDSFRPDPVARAALRKELAVSDEATVIGMVARFDPMKDFETFFSAASLLHQTKPDTVFVVAGRGVDKTNPEVTRIVERHGLTRAARLIGYRRDVPAVLAGFDIGSSSSAYGEGFSNAVAEMMACEVVPVATAVGDTASIVGVCGRVVPPRDPRALANAWREVIDWPAARRMETATRARQRIIENYSLSRVAEEYTQFYERLAAGASD